MTIENLYTVGEVADKLGEPPARVQYIISKHRIKPAERVGIYRLFNDSQVEQVRNGLFNIQVRADK